jgi:lysophospholipase L1-like esterase
MTLALRSQAPVRVVWDGQSMNNNPPPPNAMPNFAMSGLGVPWTADPAIGGTGWPALLTTIATRLGRHRRPGLDDILVMNGGQDGILTQGRTGAQVYADAIAYRDAAVALGFGPVMITTMPDWADGFYTITGTMDTHKASHNALVLANSGGFDAVVDISVAPLNDALNTTYFAIDRLHLNATGAAAAGAILAPAIVSLIASL